VTLQRLAGGDLRQVCENPGRLRVAAAFTFRGIETSSKRQVRRDHRPLWLKRVSATYHQLWAQHFLHPQFDAIGRGLVVYGPQHIEVTGRNIRVGCDVHMMANRDKPIRFTSYADGKGGGAIDVGDYSIVLPGVRLASASSIRVGRNCMFATNAYVTDADWHDLYDRTAAPGGTAPVVLEDNVWIGDSAIVCKGVRVGENSVIGAGAVVTHDIASNSIAAGNPARVVRTLDPARALVRRESLFAGEVPWAQYIDGFERWVLTPNTIRTWLRSKLAPTREL
jgi:acetyltransferase-like isoleucine patch superfamily enzyme